MTHVCNDTDDEWVVCIDGVIYGPCEAEMCGGECIKFYPCDCPCHDKE